MTDKPQIYASESLTAQEKLELKAERELQQHYKRLREAAEAVFDAWKEGLDTASLWVTDRRRNSLAALKAELEKV